MRTEPKNRHNTCYKYYVGEVYYFSGGYEGDLPNLILACS